MFKNVVVTPTGVKLGSKGRVMNTPEKVGTLLGERSKGEARKIRKTLFKAGKKALAAAPRKVDKEKIAA